MEITQIENTGFPTPGGPENYAESIIVREIAKQNTYMSVGLEHCIFHHENTMPYWTPEVKENMFNLLKKAEREKAKEALIKSVNEGYRY